LETWYSRLRRLAATLGVLMAAACGRVRGATTGRCLTHDKSWTDDKSGHTDHGLPPCQGTTSLPAVPGWRTSGGSRHFKVPSHQERFTCARSSRHDLMLGRGAGGRRARRLLRRGIARAGALVGQGRSRVVLRRRVGRSHQFRLPDFDPASFSRRSTSAARPRTASCWTLRSPPTARVVDRWRGHPTATASRSAPVEARR